MMVDAMLFTTKNSDEFKKDRTSNNINEYYGDGRRLEEEYDSRLISWLFHRFILSLESRMLKPFLSLCVTLDVTVPQNFPWHHMIEER